MPLPRFLLATVLAAAVPAAAIGQNQSLGYKFLDAVEKEDANKVIEMVETPGSTIINTKQVTTGRGALHVLTSHAGSKFFTYLLQHNADPNIRDGKNNTPMVLAATLGREDLVRLLLSFKANPNLANSSGQTPLIIAVNNRDVGTARTLLTGGADPDQTDNLAGMSARDYATKDNRYPALAALFADTPRKAKRAVAGPRL